MKVIKRYPNRKLYDTEEKKYVSLPEIREFVKRGLEIQVLDNETGEDLTGMTLSQILYEQEKSQAGFLPPSLLVDLVRAGGTRVAESLRRLAGTGLGKGSGVGKTLRRVLGKSDQPPLSSAEPDLESIPGGEPEDHAEGSWLEERVQGVVDRLGLATKSDLDEVARLVTTLEDRLDELLVSRSGRKS